MATDRQLDERISTWLEAEAPGQMPDRVLRATFERTRKSRQRVGWRALPGKTQMPRFVTALVATAGLVVAVVAFGQRVNQPGVGSDPSPTPAASPTATALPSDARLSACSDPGRPVAATVLGCSRDGTSLLVQKGSEFHVLRADGSETEVADLSHLNDLGSARPSGATISPDGSRVVFAGLTKTSAEGHRSCHDGALFTVDADGGPAEVLWESQVPQNGIVRDPTFSPDGAHIAFVDGYCDSDHSVWVMNADGSDAHQIVSSDVGPLSATHVHGLAWSPAGDRIAIQVDQGTFTFASDGSDFKVASGTPRFCWPGRQCSAGIP